MTANLSPALAPLAALRQWVGWRLEAVPGREGPQKVPYSPVKPGYRASSVDPSDWGSHDEALAMPGMSGVGFVFTHADPYAFVDIDHALQPDGSWSPLALTVCALFQGAAVEVSQSGTGLHIFGRYAGPEPDHGKRNTALGLELYTAERFAALTDTNTVGSVEADISGALAAAIATYFPAALGGNRAPLDWTDEPCEDWKGYENDEELIAAAIRSGQRNAAVVFGSGKASFEDLWTANADALASSWPPTNTSDAWNRSSADAALASHLAFWTGRDCARIERLMRQSELAREKWDVRDDYLPTTILKACSVCREVHKRLATGKPEIVLPPMDPAVAKAAGMSIKTGSPISLPNDQMELFKGCVYIRSRNEVFMPSGVLLNKARFDVEFGGREFVYMVETQKTTDSAWDALLMSQLVSSPRADGLCFRPELPAGAIVDEGGLELLNSYVPVDPDEEDGPADKFIEFVRKLLPAQLDQDIMLHYMASMAQNVGKKFFWWPVVQGVQGNGKSLLITVMRHIVSDRYSHLPNAAKMVSGGMNFNGWIDRKLFIGLEEVKAAERRQFFEAFKTTVSNLSIPVEAKGVEEVTTDNRANGCICTNHQDGVVVDDNERRYAVFFTAQQEAADLIRDGMTSDYFADLHDWAFGRNAYADKGARYGLRCIQWYLRRYPLRAELDPARGATRAPRTTSMDKAVKASLGFVEQEVLEAIGEGRSGFAGAWVSSIKLNALLQDERLHVPQNKRRDLMRSIGYDYHPALEPLQGRVNRCVLPDNGKPRLYCKVGSIEWNAPYSIEDVCAAYAKAQQAAFGQAVGATA